MNSNDSSSGEEDDMALPRLIAQFPGVDIGILSSSLEKAQGDLNEAIALVRQVVNVPANQVKKTRPTGSSRGRREQIEQQDTQLDPEDEELSRQLSYQEQRASVNAYNQSNFGNAYSKDDEFGFEVDQNTVIQNLTNSAIKDAATYVFKI